MAGQVAEAPNVNRSDLLDEYPSRHTDHTTLPNGLGVDFPNDEGDLVLTGAATNELTSLGHEDPFAGTPWHKHVPARVEGV